MPATSSSDLSIFVCYRRADTSGEAVALSDKLNRRRGFETFKDVDSIRPGQDWLEAVEAAVAKCDVLLALIGSDWISAADEYGHSLDENDRVRREIEAALAGKKAVIPVLFENATLPRSNELPESLRPLLRRHSIRIRNSTFNRDLEVLVDQLKVIARAKRLAQVAEQEPARPEGTTPTSAASTAAAAPSVGSTPAATAAGSSTPAGTPPAVKRFGTRPSLPPPPPSGAGAARPAAPAARAQQPEQPSTPTPIEVRPVMHQPAPPVPTLPTAPAPASHAAPAPAPPTPPVAGPWLTPHWPAPAGPAAARQATWVPLSAGIALAISGGLVVLIGLVALVDPNSIGLEYDSAGAGVLLGVLGGAELVAAFGVFRRQRWSRVVGCIAAAIVGLFYLAALDLVSLVIAVIHGLIIVGLLMGKTYFEQPPAPVSQASPWR